MGGAPAAAGGGGGGVGGGGAGASGGGAASKPAKGSAAAGDDDDDDDGAGATMTVGGGEVHIGGRVFINGKEVTGGGAPTQAPTQAPPRPAAPRVDTASFDVTGFLSTAEKQARAIYDDAVLVRIDAEGVFPDGRARLKMVDDWSVLYRFVSPSRRQRPKDLPKGVPFKPNCKIYVNVTAKGVNTYPLDGWECDEPLIGKPRCSARELWQKARSLGATDEEAAAEIGYWAGPGGKGRWNFSIEDDFSNWISDDC